MTRIGLAWVAALAFLWLAEPDGASLAWGGAVIAAGLAVRGWAAAVLDKNRCLAVTGPYAHTRNPLYLGSLLMGAGAVVAGGRPWLGAGLLAALAVIYRGTISREDDGLARRFGDSYARYRAAVPVLVPRLTPYRAPPEAHASPVRPSAARYAHNREYEALIGAAAAFGVLWFKTLLG